MLLILLAVENTIVVQLPHPWFNMYLYRGLPIVFGLALVFFGRPQFRTSFIQSRAIQPVPIGVHVVTLGLWAVLEIFLLLRFGSLPPGPSLRVAVWLWLALFPVLAATLFLSFLPLKRVFALARSLGVAWLYAAISSALVVVLRERFRLAWGASSSRVGSAALAAAFSEAKWLLGLFYPHVVQDRSTHLLGTDRFLVIVGGTCSGLEGLALMSAFSAVWLIYARRELRLARALLLIPVALGLMWALNLFRLVALIAIGDAGHPEVATQGFHSEAGWIAFNLVSLGFLFTAQNIQWFRKADRLQAAGGASYAPPESRRIANIPAVYLGPFLAITAASVLSQAASAGFDRFYPLRFLAALAVLWAYRWHYRKLDWHFSAVGLLTGVGVAAMWLGIHHLLASSGSGGAEGAATAVGLSTLPHPARIAWVTVRVLAAVVTVPVAEELAFRGYLARRLTDPDPESVSFSRLTVWGIAGSSIAFGLVHGHMWPAGILAGFAFALVARRKGRFGEAVAAHAVANLLIAIVALARHDYTLW